MELEDEIRDYLSKPVTDISATALMDVRSRLSSAAIELRSLRVRCRVLASRVQDLERQADEVPH